MSEKRVKKPAKAKTFSYFPSLTWNPAAKIIIEKFFLRMRMQGEFTMLEKLNFLFSTKTREIEFYRVVKPGRVVGVLIGREARNEGITPDRNFYKGEIMLVRRDDFNFYYDIQIFTKFSQESEARWYRIKKKYLRRLLNEHLERIKEPSDES